MSGQTLLLESHRSLETPRSSTRPRGSASRRGTSLLEVMIATVMLMGCVMALSRVAFLARRHAHGAEDRSLSQIHCQNILEEIMAGVRPLQSAPPTAFEGDMWVYAVDVEEMKQAGLTQVAVTVDRLDDPEDPLPTEDDLVGYRLVRWVRSGDRKVEPDMLQGDSGEIPEEPLDDLE